MPKHHSTMVCKEYEDKSAHILDLDGSKWSVSYFRKSSWLPKTM